MSIEAQALGRLITTVESVKNKSFAVLHDSMKEVIWATGEASYWITPVQSHRDVIYAMWENNPAWDRADLLAYCLHLPSPWFTRCLVLGDMNYRVENEGFYGWAKAGLATPVDLNQLVELCGLVKTPVGVNVYGIIRSVRSVLESNAWGSGDGEELEGAVQDLDILTQGYISQHYQFLTDVEQIVRRDVPVFQPKPQS